MSQRRNGIYTVLDTVCLLGGGLQQLEEGGTAKQLRLVLLLRLSETVIFVELGFINTLTWSLVEKPKQEIPKSSREKSKSKRKI